MFLEHQINILQWFLKDHPSNPTYGCWKFSFAVWNKLHFNIRKHLFKMAAYYFTVLLFLLYLIKTFSLDEHKKLSK